MNRLAKTFAASFIQGALALLPMIVCAYLLFLVFSFFESIADNLLVVLPRDLQSLRWVRVGVEASAIAALIAGIAVFGVLVRTLIGRAILKQIDALFTALPGVDSIYKATQQVVNVVRAGNRQFLTHPVFVEYPSPGIWAIAFNTGRTPPNFGGREDPTFTVFIPTTPNPTSGFLAVVPRSKFVELDISVEDAIKMILTGGIVKGPAEVVAQTAGSDGETRR